VNTNTFANEIHAFNLSHRLLEGLTHETKMAKSSDEYIFIPSLLVSRTRKSPHQ